jgi:hypothetical protein
MHVHIGPEIVPRRYTAARLANELREHQMGAVVKHHFIPTTYLVSGVAAPDVLTGSVTLNSFCGGIHPDALRSAVSGMRDDTMQSHPSNHRYMVWMPTLSAKTHLTYYGRDLDEAWGVPVQYAKQQSEARSFSVLDADGQLTANVEAVLKEIAANDLILGTGHLGRGEIFALVQRAVEVGVKRIVITHAFFPPHGLSLDDQATLARLPGVYIEHSWFVAQVDGVTMRQYAEAIRLVGPEKTILSSDGGQVVSDPIPQAWCKFVTALQDEGLSLTDIACMGSENPRRLLFGDSK